MKSFNSAVVTFILSFLPFMGVAFAEADKTPESLYKIGVETISGEKEMLEKYKGKVLLIVNTASECGFTPQYEALEKTYEKYKDKGFVILGFPSNDFGAQEPGSNAEIKAFCDRKFKVKFPLFAKNPVGGKKPNGEVLAQPVYQYLLKNAPVPGPIVWNFEKFLVTKNGRIANRFRSKVKPDSEELTKAIEGALAEK